MHKRDQRYRLDWYTKRANQNQHIKQYLIRQIIDHDPRMTQQLLNLSFLNYEDLFELAVASANKRLNIVLGAGRDFSNNMDAKFSIVRTHSLGRAYGANIGCRNKQGILAGVYEPLRSQFYFFALPAVRQEVDIPFQADGEPRRQNPWWQYQCRDLRHMSQQTLLSLDTSLL